MDDTQVYMVGKFLESLSLSFHHHHHHHHHHVPLVARISLTLSRHFSLSFIALGRSSGQHPVSSHTCWMYVLAGRPAFARPCVGVHKSTSLMSSSLLPQQCPALPWLYSFTSEQFNVTVICWHVTRLLEINLFLLPWKIMKSELMGILQLLYGVADGFDYQNSVLMSLK